MLTAALLAWALHFEEQAHLTYMTPRGEVPPAQATVMVLLKGICRCEVGSAPGCCDADAPKFFFQLSDALRLMNEAGITGAELRGVYRIQKIDLEEQDKWRE
jgi:hypothetical protein